MTSTTTSNKMGTAREMTSPVSLGSDDVIVYLLSGVSPISREAWSKLGCYYLSHFYKYPINNNQDNITPKKLARSIIGILGLFFRSSDIVGDEELRTAAHQAGLILEYRIIEENEALLLHSHHYDKFKANFQADPNWRDPLQNPDGVLVFDHKIYYIFYGRRF